MKDVDPRLLQTFEAVLEHGSITAAAAALGYVPSAVSQHVSRLEAQLGVPLLHRSRDGATATTQGEALRGAATLVLAALADLRDHAADVAGRQERLHIGVFASAATELLVPALVDVHRQHPDVALSLQQCEPPEGLRALATGRIDVLLAHQYEADSLQYDPGLLVELIGVEPLILCAGAGSIVPRDLQDSDHCDWVAGSAGTPDRRLLTHFCTQNALTPRVSAETDDYHVASNYIAAGLGIGFLPASLLASAGRTLRTIKTATAPHRTVLLLRRRRATTPAIDALLSAARHLLQHKIDVAGQV